MIQEYLARLRTGQGQADNPTALGSPVGKSFGNKIIFERRPAETVSQLPIEPANTQYYIRDAVLRPGGNLKLPAEIGGPGVISGVISDGAVWWPIANSENLLPTFIHAEEFGVVPNTGADMTAAFVTAIARMPENHTLRILPGVYVIQKTALAFNRNFSVYAVGVTFDVGVATLADTDWVVTFGNKLPSSNSGKIRRQSWQGGVVKRTMGGTTVADTAGIGFKWQSLYECDVRDAVALGFRKGHLVTGSYDAVGDEESGNAYNNYYNLQGINNKWSLRLEPGDSQNPPQRSGWCNENNFFGGRHGNDFSSAPGPTLGADYSAAIYIQWATAGGLAEIHECNNNRFYGLSLENIWGRKIYNESRYNQFIGCRYEGFRAGPGGVTYGGAVPNSTDIEFQNTNAAGGSVNWLQGGYDLLNCIIYVPSEFENFICDHQTLHIERIKMRESLNTGGSGGSNPAPLRVTNLFGGLSDAVEILASNDSDVRLRFRASPDNVSYLGGIVGCTGAGIERNWLGVRNGSDFHWGVQKGMRVNVSGDTAGDFKAQGLTDPDLLTVDASADRVGIGTATPAQLLDVDGIAQIDQLIVNDAAANVDARMEGTTDANAFYLDADAAGGSIGIGTNVPDGKLDVRGTTVVRTTAIDAFRVTDAAGNEKFHVNTDDLVIHSNMDHDFTALLIARNGLSIERTDVTTTPFTVLRSHMLLSVNTSSAKTLNLPALSGVNDDMVLFIKARAGASNVTVSPNGSDTIDGAASLTLTPGQAVMLVGPDSTTDWEIY